MRPIITVQTCCKPLYVSICMFSCTQVCREASKAPFRSCVTGPIIKPNPLELNLYQGAFSPAILEKNLARPRVRGFHFMTCRRRNSSKTPFATTSRRLVDLRRSNSKKLEKMEKSTEFCCDPVTGPMASSSLGLKLLRHRAIVAVGNLSPPRASSCE